MDRIAYIYKIENILNGKFYIGVSISPKERFTAHKSTARTGKNAHHIHHAMKQHINNIDEIFKLTVTDIFASEDEAYQEEIRLVAKYREQGIAIYNESDGGDRGPVMFGSDNPFYGKHHSDETIKLLSEISIGRSAGEKNYFYGKSFSGANHPLYGTKRPQNVLDALSKAHKGKIISEELKARWSESRKGQLVGEKNPMFGKYGELNPNHGISDIQAIEIHKQYHVDKKLVREIIEMTGISKSTIDRIIYGYDRFKWLKNYEHKIQI
jgi:predicted GIY-YIG superfamily endonuclease